MSLLHVKWERKQPFNHCYKDQKTSIYCLYTDSVILKPLQIQAISKKCSQAALPTPHGLLSPALLLTDKPRWQEADQVDVDNQRDFLEAISAPNLRIYLFIWAIPGGVPISKWIFPHAPGSLCLAKLQNIPTLLSSTPAGGEALTQGKRRIGVTLSVLKSDCFAQPTKSLGSTLTGK